jgi:hypothetical protein
MGHRAEARRRPVAPLAVQAELSEQEGCAKADEALFLRHAEGRELFECLVPSPHDFSDLALLLERRNWKRSGFQQFCVKTACSVTGSIQVPENIWLSRNDGKSEELTINAISWNQSLNVLIEGYRSVAKNNRQPFEEAHAPDKHQYSAWWNYADSLCAFFRQAFTHAVQAHYLHVLDRHPRDRTIPEVRSSFVWCPARAKGCKL